MLISYPLFNYKNIIIVEEKTLSKLAAETQILVWAFWPMIKFYS